MFFFFIKFREIWYNFAKNVITRTVRHRVKVSAPVLFWGIFSCSRLT